jgi:hypothetical protein
VPATPPPRLFDSIRSPDRWAEMRRAAGRVFLKRKRRELQTFYHPDSRGHRGLWALTAVTFRSCCGVACFPLDAHSPEALLEKSDEAMYHGKKTGRDGVSFFGVDAVLIRGDGAPEERATDRLRE